jgi:beta-N-acetylhexosaminidase
MTNARLREAALGCLFPGFEGLEPPEWIRRRLSEGLDGVVLYARNVESREQLAALTAALRAEREDALVAIDEEGGDVTRLEASTGSSYPGNAALGAVDDVELTEQVAAALGADLREVGVTLDLAPVADVNSNPANPIIGIRSFGVHTDLVSRHVAAFVRGLQSVGVAACAKHFPGHGDTSADSHLELPTIDVDRATLLERELPPFRAAIEAGTKSLMTAHIRVPALDDEPATLSRVFLTELLRDELGFDGMVMTDALEMRAISASVGVEEGAVRAIAAGADALCFGHDLADDDVESVVTALERAVAARRIPEERLVEASGRVREVAAWARSVRMAERPGAGVGVDAARRALHVDGRAQLARDALVVELVTTPSIAAGKSRGPGETLTELLPRAQLLHLSERDHPEPRTDQGRQLVVVTKDAHRHAWQREMVESLVHGGGDAIVVEVGLPHWRPKDSSAYVVTYGSARVNLEAAAAAIRG